MQMRRRNDQDSAEGMQEMKGRGGQENLKGQTETTRWTEDERRSSGVPSEKVWWRKKKKKKVPKIETRSDRRGGKERKSLEKEGVFVSERHSLSRGRAERNNGRKDGGMKG